jgi:hypothetical protein
LGSFHNLPFGRSNHHAANILANLRLDVR